MTTKTIATHGSPEKARGAFAKVILADLDAAGRVLQPKMRDLGTFKLMMGAVRQARFSIQNFAEHQDEKIVNLPGFAKNRISYVDQLLEKSLEMMQRRLSPVKHD